jgi:two-component system, chemotaxis family, chemotaxis protein CheY
MPTIVSADDSSMVHKMLQKFLKDTEFEILGFARDGREAVELYRQNTPDIVTLDITMPEMNGIEALHGIREIDPGAVCLMCSALDQQGLLEQALREGASGYLVKPFKAPELLAKLREHAPENANE